MNLKYYIIVSYVQMKNQAFAGSALVALGVATGSLLAPQAASALDFTFFVSQLNGVTGLITGLVEGTNSCTVGGACFVTVLDDAATGLPTGNYFNSSPNPFGIFEGFTVSGNSITAYSFFGSKSGLLPVDVGLDMPVLILVQSFSSNNGLGEFRRSDGGGASLST